MSERVHIFVGNNKKPTIGFDLKRGVLLADALEEITKSIRRRMAAKTAPDAPESRSRDATKGGTEEKMR